MASFISKKITNGQSLADKLRKTRLEKGVELSQVEKDTKISVKYLEILESGDYQQLPGDMYARAWLKLYADYLELDERDLLSDYKVEKTISDKLKKVAEPAVKDKTKPHKILRPINLKMAGVVMVALALFGYLGWEVKNIIAAPDIQISQPDSNLRTTDSSVEIVGSTEPEVQLTINNELVLLDEDGNFKQSVNLISGLNNLSISAKKKHSRTNEMQLVILREDQ